MRVIRVLLVILLAAAVTVVLANSGQAQLGGLKDKAKKKAEEKAKQKAEEEAQKAVEETEESTEEESTTDESPAESEPEEGQTSTQSPKASGKPGEGVWVNYDFVPGARVLYFNDFSNDVVGNFPQRLELLKGNMEVAEWNGRRWLRTTTYGDFLIPLPEVLPDKFTLEFDMYAPADWNVLEIVGTPPEGDGGYENTEICFSPYGTRAGVQVASGNEGLSITQFPEKFLKDVMHCRALADGKYMKVYVNEIRVANFPNTKFLRANSLTFSIAADPEYPLMLADLRVAVSDKTMYDALVADGRVATQGIFFDSGSDRIRPESTPTLKEIGSMLTAHEELKLAIEGHTDNVGDDATNQALSERRANAVRDYLIKEFTIGTDRLTAAGYGESKPVSSNDTPEGRQNNRRVELVKT